MSVVNGITKRPILATISRMLSSTLGAALLACAGPAFAAPCSLNEAPRRCTDGVNYMYCTGTSTSTRWDTTECIPSAPQPKGPPDQK